MKTKKLVNWIADAQNNWATDEAYGIFCTHQRRKENDWTQDELDVALSADRAHMVKVFSTEPDADALIAAFNAELTKLLNS